MDGLKNKYFVKNIANGTFTDVTTLVDGVRILQIEGMAAKGKAINVYNQQWMDGSEDFLITMMDNSETPVIIRENMDIKVTFLVKQKYATNTIDVLTQHNTFVNYMTNTDVWLKSAYMNNMVAHCVCLDNYEPTLLKLNRGDESFAMGTITFHCLDTPKSTT